MKALLNKAPETQTLYEDLGKKCLEHDEGRLLKYVGSTATARDIISMADALEGPDKPVNYVGISYGTLIGSLFINSMPGCINIVYGRPTARLSASALSS